MQLVHEADLRGFGVERVERAGEEGRWTRLGAVANLIAGDADEVGRLVAEPA